MAGRPTDYRPEYCELILEHCREGKSLASFCDRIGISRQTLYQWKETHPRFSDAVSRALLAAQTWWESECQKNVGNRNFNSRVAEFIMASRYEDYRPQAQRLEISGPNGQPVRVLSDSDLARLAAPALEILDAEIVGEPPKQLENPRGNLPESSKTEENQVEGGS